MRGQGALSKAAGYVRSDPIRAPRFAVRHLRERLASAPHERAVTRFGDVELPLDLTAHSIMRKYYFRTYEMQLERIFRRCLRPGDTFLDVGANIGYWSALVAHRVGPEGQVHLFEPVEHHHALLVEFNASTRTGTWSSTRSPWARPPGRR